MMMAAPRVYAKMADDGLLPAELGVPKGKIDDELEMTFRRLYTGQGVHNYFWKARPRR